MRRALVVAVGVVAFTLVPAGAAGAHPLGNFTVNHSDALLLTPDGIGLTAVVDRAEIPTAQALQDIAPDGPPGTQVLADTAAAECAALSGDLRLAVDGTPLPWTVQATALEVVPGAAGLPTLRLTCELQADADLGSASTVAFADEYLSGQVGWREITAAGDGVRLIDSPVPVVSPTDQLLEYPEELLSSPVDVRSLEVSIEPGEDTGTGAALAGGSGDPFGRAMADLDRRLQDLVGDGELTPLVGTLAVVLALLLGCGHALLPGHGKTVMAAYLAGRSGRPRDALTVGATVTATHTVGVLVLGAAVSLSSTLAGDQVLRWLGVVSGALVAVIGAFMLRGAVRTRRAEPPEQHLPEPAFAVGVPALANAGVRVPGSPPAVDHPHDHHHDHDHDHDHSHDDDGARAWWTGRHTHGPGEHTHGPAVPGRGGLVGMGVAGGLVPSPSALVVLIASIGLGRTVFGVVLVVAYGLGMAATLTAVGLALVRMRDRLSRRLYGPSPSTALRFVARAAPLATAALVLVVGLALVVRGVALGA